MTAMVLFAIGIPVLAATFAARVKRCGQSMSAGGDTGGCHRKARFPESVPHRFHNSHLVFVLVR
jgi:hypothetical protein